MQNMEHFERYSSTYVKEGVDSCKLVFVETLSISD